MKKFRFVSLRYRYIMITSIMLLVLLATLAIVLAILQTRTIRGSIKENGLSIAKNLAAISVDHLVTYNYIALEKMVNQAVNNPEIIYAIVYDKEGKVAGHSRRPDLQNKIMHDRVSINAIETQKILITVNNFDSNRSSVMDVTVPVYIPRSSDKWGTVRVGLSLELMHLQIRQTLWSILILGFIALAIGIFISNWAAQRVTRPLKILVQASVKAAQGNLDQEISIHTRDEVEILASNFSSMIREILAQKQQLENHFVEIKRLHQYAEKILETMSDGLLGVDMNGIVTFVNPAARNILDVPRGETVKGYSFLKLFSNDREFSAYIQQSLENPAAGNHREIKLQRGEDVRILLTGSGVLKSDKEKIQQIIFNINDITALKKLEAQIRQSQRLADLGTMAAGMAHEIRNPLSAIQTYVTILPKKIKKPGFLEKFQKTVPREIKRLNTIIEELLELSRPPKYDFKLTDIRLVLIQSIELLDTNFKTSGIDCNWDISNKLPQVMADADQLEKVFINLMQNGAQAMSDGGVITINAYFENTGVVIDFKDTGHGFSSEIAENIFNPFFTTKTKGTGLGLAITHKVISEHGGVIKTTSKQGKGSCFSITIPAVSQDYESS